MRILIFHGYLLRGTGSNVYNAELARALAEAGHDVHLLCQDRVPEALDFVDAVGEWPDGVLTVRDLHRDRAAGHGRCTVYLPPIGEMLPVYVADRYEGFNAKTFDQLTDQELDHYLERNVDAVRDVCALAPPDGALANHLVMGPCILTLGLAAGIPLAVKIHGSALEYTVRPHPRFLPHAVTGIDRAATVLVGSEHTARRLWETVPSEHLVERTYLGPPGVDISRFVRRDKSEAAQRLADVANQLERVERRGFDAAAAAAVDELYGRLDELGYDEVAREVGVLHEAYDTAGIDADAPAAVRELAAAVDAGAPVALFVGKLIVSKGVDLLLAAWPLVLGRFPDARLVITGFGAYREGLELMVRALADGDLKKLRWLAAGGRAVENGAPDPLSYLQSFLRLMDDEERSEYFAAAAAMPSSMHWFGRLEHDLLTDLIPFTDAQIVPSTFPEAFGMVAAEAAACGVPPICANHSGLAEVTEILEAVVDPEVGQLLGFDLGPGAVLGLAARIVAILSLDPDARERTAEALAEVSVERFSWAGVARGVVEAASGRHDTLSRP